MEFLFGLLPLLTTVASWIALYSPDSSSAVRRDLRLSVIGAWLLTTLAMVATTEVLSLFAALKSPWPMRLVWLAMAGSTLAAASLQRRNARELARAAGQAFARDRLVLGLIGVMAVFALSSALFTPPNTYDSLTYHVARTESWLQQGTVAHFATSDLRQIEFAPLNAFWFLHLALLTGSDLLLNTLQLGALVFVLLPSASFLCEKLGARANVRGLLLVSIAATPMIILQASSTQNDVLLASLLLASLCLGWLFLEAPSLALGALLGVALGLCVFTKGTALVFGLSYAGWFAFHAFRRRSRLLALSLAPAVALSVLINVGHYARNYVALGSIFGEAAAWNRPSGLTLAGLLSNIAKNLSLNISTPVYSLNGHIERVFRAVHDRLLPVSVDDPGLNFFGEPFFIANAWNDEEHAANLLQLALVLLCGVCALWRRLRPRDPKAPPRSELARGFGWATALAFVCFSGLLNWQIWGNRLLTPWFAVALVACAPELETFTLRAGWLRVATACVFIAGLPWMLASDLRPLVGSRSVLLQPRDSQWFASWPEQGKTYSALLQELERRSFETLGLHLGGERLTAPVLPLLRHSRARGGTTPFVHVGVRNASGKLATPTREPDLVVSNHKPLAETVEIDARCYARSWHAENLALYVPAPCAAPLSFKD